MERADLNTGKESIDLILTGNVFHKEITLGTKEKIMVVVCLSNRSYKLMGMIVAGIWKTTVWK